jgi:hypothetical protein
LSEDKTGNDYEIGTLIVPKAVLGDAELNHNDDTADEVDVDYEEIDCSKKWLPNDELPGAQAGYKYYNAALTEIPTVEYNTVLVARSYYVKDGVYTYSDPVERSIGYVAAAALNDGYNDTNEILTNIVKTGYGETELTIEGASFASTGDVEAFTASNDKGYLPVWSTSNADIATVDKKGKVTAKKVGTTVLTVKDTSGRTYNCYIDVVKNHEWMVEKIIKEATCSEQGTKLYFCIHCGANKKENYEASRKYTRKAERCAAECSVKGTCGDL